MSAISTTNRTGASTRVDIAPAQSIDFGSASGPSANRDELQLRARGRSSADSPQLLASTAKGSPSTSPLDYGTSTNFGLPQFNTPRSPEILGREQGVEVAGVGSALQNLVKHIPIAETVQNLRTLTNEEAMRAQGRAAIRPEHLQEFRDAWKAAGGDRDERAKATAILALRVGLGGAAEGFVQEIKKNPGGFAAEFVLEVAQDFTPVGQVDDALSVVGAGLAAVRFAQGVQQAAGAGSLQEAEQGLALAVGGAKSGGDFLISVVFSRAVAGGVNAGRNAINGSNSNSSSNISDLSYQGVAGLNGNTTSTSTNTNQGGDHSSSTVDQAPPPRDLWQEHRQGQIVAAQRANSDALNAAKNDFSSAANPVPGGTALPTGAVPSGAPIRQHNEIVGRTYSAQQSTAQQKNGELTRDGVGLDTPLELVYIRRSDQVAQHGVPETVVQANRGNISARELVALYDSEKIDYRDVQGSGLTEIVQASRQIVELEVSVKAAYTAATGQYDLNNPSVRGDRYPEGRYTTVGRPPQVRIEMEGGTPLHGVDATRKAEQRDYAQLNEQAKKINAEERPGTVAIVFNRVMEGTRYDAHIPTLYVGPIEGVNRLHALNAVTDKDIKSANLTERYSQFQREGYDGPTNEARLRETLSRAQVSTELVSGIHRGGDRQRADRVERDRGTSEDFARSVTAAMNRDLSFPEGGTAKIVLSQPHLEKMGIEEGGMEPWRVRFYTSPEAPGKVFISYQGINGANGAIGSLEFTKRGETASIGTRPGPQADTIQASGAQSIQSMPVQNVQSSPSSQNTAPSAQQTEAPKHELRLPRAGETTPDPELTRALIESGKVPLRDVHVERYNSTSDMTIDPARVEVMKASGTVLYTPQEGPRIVIGKLVEDGTGASVNPQGLKNDQLRGELRGEQLDEVARMLGMERRPGFIAEGDHQLAGRLREHLRKSGVDNPEQYMEQMLRQGGAVPSANPSSAQAAPSVSRTVQLNAYSKVSEFTEVYKNHPELLSTALRGWGSNVDVPLPDGVTTKKGERVIYGVPKNVLEHTLSEIQGSGSSTSSNTQARPSSTQIASSTIGTLEKPAVPARRGWEYQLIVPGQSPVEVYADEVAAVSAVINGQKGIEHKGGRYLVEGMGIMGGAKSIDSTVGKCLVDRIEALKQPGGAATSSATNETDRRGGERAGGDIARFNRVSPASKNPTASGASANYVPNNDGETGTLTTSRHSWSQRMEVEQKLKNAGLNPDEMGARVLAWRELPNGQYQLLVPHISGPTLRTAVEHYNLTTEEVKALHKQALRLMKAVEGAGLGGQLDPNDGNFIVPSRNKIAMIDTTLPGMNSILDRAANDHGSPGGYGEDELAKTFDTLYDQARRNDNMRGRLHAVNESRDGHSTTTSSTLSYPRTQKEYATFKEKVLLEFPRDNAAAHRAIGERLAEMANQPGVELPPAAYEEYLTLKYDGALGIFGIGNSRWVPK